MGPGKRLLVAVVLFLTVYTVGVLSFWAMSGKPFGQCAFNTLIFLATVDRPFDPSLPFTNSIGYRVLCAVLLVAGMGSVLYMVSTATALIVEGFFSDVLRRRRMQAEIDKLRGHVIVCGAGRTGIHIIDELYKLELPFVTVDHDEGLLKRAGERYKGLLYVVGDATEEEVLLKAGVERARGVIAALPTDEANLFVTMTARQLNPKIRVVSKAIDLRTDKKLRKAGADSVVSPNYIGRLRMVSEMVRPKTVLFLDKMLRDPLQTTRIDEVRIGAGSELCGKTLEETRLGARAGVLVLAIRYPDKDEFVFRPAPTARLVEDAVLVVLGSVSDIKRAREIAKQPEPLPE